MDEERLYVMRTIGLALGLLGMVIGCYSAWFELTKGASAPTSGYVALGVAAFVLPIGAGVAPLVLRRQSARAGVVMIALGTLGYLARALDSTRTLYFVALVCWVLGSGALLLASRSGASSTQ
jgi:putative Mn2+ efflux pump MntP